MLEIYLGNTQDNLNNVLGPSTKSNPFTYIPIETDYKKIYTDKFFFVFNTHLSQPGESP